MARGLLDLAKSLEARAKAIPALASGLAKGAALELLKGLATNTPVDTSKAISSWVITLDAPSTADVDPHFVGIGGSTYAASSRETVILGQVALLAKKPGQTIFITNTADYIRDLNEGSSMQAPAGFVEAEVFKVKRMLKGLPNG